MPVRAVEFAAADLHLPYESGPAVAGWTTTSILNRPGGPSRAALAVVRISYRAVSRM
jgi:hypothetical protein